jgi:hypothetical protein
MLINLIINLMCVTHYANLAQIFPALLLLVAIKFYGVGDTRLSALGQ